MKKNIKLIITMSIILIIFIVIILLNIINISPYTKEEQALINKVQEKLNKDYAIKGYTYEFNKIENNIIIFNQKNNKSDEVCKLYKYNIKDKVFSIEEQACIDEVYAEE